MGIRDDTLSKRLQLDPKLTLDLAKKTIEMRPFTSSSNNSKAKAFSVNANVWITTDGSHSPGRVITTEDIPRSYLAETLDWTSPQKSNTS